VGLIVAGVATWLVYPVLATKNMVDMLGHIIFFGDFVPQFLFFILYFRQFFRTGLNNLLFTGIIASAGVALAIYATIQHWHDQNFDIPTPSLGCYFPFIR
jgi:prepilin signal peptidase PulO-like enzyme (type II secretory pathway)